MSSTAQIAATVAWMVFGTGSVVQGQEVETAIAVKYPDAGACTRALAKLEYREHNEEGGRMTIKPFCSTAVPNWWVPLGVPAVDAR